MTVRGSDGPVIDDLVTALWEARRAARPVPADEAWDRLSADTAAAIGQTLYRRVTLDPPTAWKMGAFDELTRQRLGLPQPLVAAVMPDRLYTDATQVELRLADFVNPKLEAEIGIWSGPFETSFVPCVEVADCRFQGWQTPPFGATADFGLQGAMVFGSPVTAPETVSVRVRRDGVNVAAASASWNEALRRLACLPVPGGAGVHTATGSITPMFPAAPGLWEFEFVDLGTLSIRFS